MRPISSLPRCSPRERVWLTINYDSLHQGHVKEPAGNAVEPDGIFRIHRRQQAEGRVSTASSLHARAGRWLVIAVSGAGMLAAAGRADMDRDGRYAAANAHQRIDGVGVRAPSARSGVSSRVPSW